MEIREVFAVQLNTTSGRTVSVRFNDPRPNLTASATNTALSHMVGANVFDEEFGNVTTINRAEYIYTTTTTII